MLLLSRDVILSFLEEIQSNTQDDSIIPNTIVDKRVRETIISWDLDTPSEQLELAIMTGSMVGALAYSHTPLEFQITFALFSFIIACFDDSVIAPQARREFVHRYHFQKTQLHPLLDKLVSISLEISQKLPPYSGNLFLAGVLQYSNEDVLYMDQPAILRDLLSPVAKQYVEYVRMADGIAPPFVTAIWPQELFPDVKEYVQVLP